MSPSRARPVHECIKIEDHMEGGGTRNLAGLIVRTRPFLTAHGEWYFGEIISETSTMIPGDRFASPVSIRARYVRRARPADHGTG